MASDVVGAVVGAIAGYLFFTDTWPRAAARSSSRRSTTSRASSTISGARSSKAAGVASEGWKLLNEAHRRQPPRPAAAIQPASDQLRSEGLPWKRNLGTTNLLLGIMAAVSVLEALRAHRRRHRRLHGVSARHDARQRARGAAGRAGDGARERDSRRCESGEREGERRDGAGRSRRFTRRWIGWTTRPIACARTCRAKTSRLVGAGARRAASRSRRCCIARHERQ